MGFSSSFDGLHQIDVNGVSITARNQDGVIVSENSVHFSGGPWVDLKTKEVHNDPHGDVQVARGFFEKAELFFAR